MNIYCDYYQCYGLNWDTEYFGIKSAKIILKKPIDQDRQEELLRYCNNFDFNTIVNKGNNPRNNLWIAAKTNAILTDVNVQFVKKVECVRCLDQSSNILCNLPENKSILDIAEKEFVCSRFFNDSFLEKSKAKNIYSYWTKCAFNKSEKYFVINTRNNEVAGYLLFSLDSKIKVAFIELIAVREKFKEQKVGKSMIRKLENYLCNKKIETIRVGTQMDNISATNFYVSNKFKYSECSSIYHYWPHKK
jgi:ribosomal protein S18 acetylase RimI-like enzyme